MNIIFQNKSKDANNIVYLWLSYYLTFSTFFNPTTVVLSIGGVVFLSIIATIESAAKRTIHANTIPEIATPDKPLEFYL